MATNSIFIASIYNMITFLWLCSIFIFHHVCIMVLINYIYLKKHIEVLCMFLYKMLLYVRIAYFIVYTFYHIGFGCLVLV